MEKNLESTCGEIARLSAIHVAATRRLDTLTIVSLEGKVYIHGVT
jgi:hypothetical protein